MIEHPLKNTYVEPVTTPSKTFFRLLKYFLQFKWRIAAGLLSVAIMSSSDTASAYLIARLFEVLQKISEQVRMGAGIFVPVEIKPFDYLLYTFTVTGREESFQLIYRFAIAVIGLVMVKVVFVYIREYVMSSVQQKLLMRFRRDLFDRIAVLPIRFFDSHKTGYIMSRITNDVNNLELSLGQMVEIAQNLVYSIVFATALFTTNWQLTVVTILIFAISGEISRKFGDRIRSYSHHLTNTLAEISAFLQEKIASIRIVKLFTREQDEQQAFKQKVEANYHYSMKIVRVMALLSPTNEMFNTLAASLLVIFSGYLFIQGAMTIETMIFFLILMINLAKPIKALGEGAARIQKTLVSAGYVFELLDLEREQEGTGGHRTIQNGGIRFERVSFSYTGDAEALHDVTLEVKPGERVALVGPSGGGKSTLIGLLPRFYEVTQGRIVIDDVAIQDFDLRALRSQIAMVPQDVILFSGTIEDNIRYGRPNATRAEVIEAAKGANAHIFIEQLEHGYLTEVGERGLQLSGGQRQRIAIARAVLCDPKILLLDEATSALDTESELMVQEALDRLMKGRTSLVIAHRLSTVANCDRVVVLDKGRVVESGTHRQLLNKQGGLFKRLHALQFADDKKAERSKRKGNGPRRKL